MRASASSFATTVLESRRKTGSASSTSSTAARARNEEGLGLGLSIVKSVVSAHGWKVRLSEDTGIGTSFVISIQVLLSIALALCLGGCFVVKTGAITAITVLDHSHGPGHGSDAIIDRVIAAQSLDVDVVSGATLSSKVILKAIETALEKGM
jgi:hypothetical protein